MAQTRSNLAVDVEHCPDTWGHTGLEAINSSSEGLHGECQGREWIACSTRAAGCLSLFVAAFVTVLTAPTESEHAQAEGDRQVDNSTETAVRHHCGSEHAAA